MKTKGLILAAMVAAAAGVGPALFALDLDFGVGGGLILGGTFSSSETDKSDLTGQGKGSVDMVYKYNTGSFDFGVEAFADCKYAELGFAYVLQNGKVTDIKATLSGTTGDSVQIGMQQQGKDKPKDEDYQNHLIVLDLLGKYPFTLSEKLSVYPALGVAFRIPIAGNDFSDYKHEQAWGLGLKGGGGADFKFSDVLSLRGEVLFYYELAADKDTKIEGPDITRVMGGDTTATKIHDFHFKDAGYYVAPQVKFAVVYKLPIGGAKAPPAGAGSNSITSD
jgi:hypothetical protein